MRKLFLIFAITIAAAPLHAAYDSSGRSQSYFTWDDGGTVVRQGDDGKEVDARVNFPLFPGDEVMTSRRGRSEIHLSDGNTIALDRSTDILFKSILNSYDGENNQTIAELHYGHVALQRTASGNDQVRLDTENASYVANEEAIYAVNADGRGRDHVTVFTGNVEVRTPDRTTRVRAGESGNVDSSGMYDLVSDSRTTDDFERWFLQRSERYSGRSSRYLDSSLSYADPDLDEHGTWVYASSYGGWCWRPYVTTGWRPYYNGHWVYGRGGALVWVSYEPWGWVPYHYGRWGYDASWGWLWFPGISYAPAWVYWMYGPGYVGWAPMGWYDCYRPYYDWAYRPYARFGFGFDYGWYGHVRVHDVDLRPWTFVTPGSMINTRVDRAALTIDAVRDRLSRSNGGFATVSAAPARFTRSEIRDPSAAVGNILRRGTGGGTGREGSGSAADVTPFFRRDPNLSSAVRDRVLRSRIVTPTAPGGGPLSGIGVRSGVPTPNTPGTLEGRVNRGDSLRRDAPQTPVGAVERGTISRGGWHQDVPVGTPSTANPSTTTGRDSRNWRDRVDRGAGVTPRSGEQPAVQTPQPSDRGRDNSWRGRDRVVRPGNDSPQTPQPDRHRSYNNGGDQQRSTVNRGSDIPRRVIDGIGGARVYGERDRGNADHGSVDRGSTRSYTPPPPPPPRSSGGGGNSGGNSGGGHSGGSEHHGSSGNSGNSGSSSNSSNSSSGSHEGHVKRN